METLGKYAGVPVWNGLTNESHPTQILADFLTMIEHKEAPLQQMKLGYLGDASFNVGCSLMVGSAIMGLDYRSVAPKELQPPQKLVDKALKIAKSSGAKI